MALCRCTQCGKPNGTKHNYVASVEPVGYPDTAVICGRSNCDNPGLIWLEFDELKAYYNGQRIFEGDTCVTKVKAKDNPLVLKGETV